MSATSTTSTDANRGFWNELCGTSLAREKGIEGTGPEAIAAFDQAFFEYYPFLMDLVGPLEVSGKRTLEIGLGYGTLGQKLAELGACYQGMDIAEGPAEMMQERLRRAGLPGRGIQGNALSLPFQDGSFDRVVAIGSLHHTGDLRSAIQEVHRVLAPGGRCLVMVYSRFSYYQWLKFPKETFAALLHEIGLRASPPEASEAQRRAYDWNEEGAAAPATEFTSRSQVRGLFRDFSEVSIRSENCTHLRLAGRTLLDRRTILPVFRLMGLDLYIHATR